MNIDQKIQEVHGQKKYWLLQFFMIFLFSILLPIVAYWSCKEYLWLPGCLHDSHEGYDCQSCHTPFRGIESEKCSLCHEKEGYESFHSYPMTFLDCTLCHLEHKGAKANITKDFPIKKDAWCSECHETPHKNPGTMISRKKEEKIFIRPGFSHKIHFEKERFLLCSDCHEWEDVQKEDFKKICYDSCLACHEDRKVENHGDWALCLKCHIGKEKPLSFSLPKIEKKESLIHRTTIGGNHEMLKEECFECHKGKQIPLETKTVYGFSHALHLPDKPKQENCLECHSSVFEAEKNLRWDGVEVCKKCHGDNKHTILIEMQEVKTQKFVFSHKTHIEGMKARAKNNILYRQECFACHTMKEGNFSLLPQEALCKKCHFNHQNYGAAYSDLEDCNYCHIGIFSLSFHNGFQKERQYPTFSHSKSPHKSIDCESCHNQKEFNRLDTRVSLNLPMCQKCHDNKEEKGQKCIDCHGYHSFFKNLKR